MIPVSVDKLSISELPAPPGGALNVVHACGREDTDAKQLSELVAQSPTLAVDILRISNSAYFGFPGEITSIARAVTLIGQSALRNMALCIAIKETLKPDELPAFPVADYWETALRRAVCCQCLAVEVGQDGDSAFCAGLLQDFGLLVLFYLNGNCTSEWPRLARLNPDERYELELQLFGTTHDRVGYLLAEAWALPDELKIALGHHHASPPEDTPPGAVEICKLTQCADWMSSVFTAEHRRKSITMCRSLLSDYYGMEAARSDELLDRLGGRITQAASAFGIKVREQVPFDFLIREANLHLVEENISFQELTWHLEHTLEEKDRIATELNRELELAREVQRSLLPDESQKFDGLVGLNVSAKAVSGDFFDYYKLQTGQTAFCIADVSGKGMNAALMMAKVSSLFHFLGKSIQDPSRLLGMLNREILETSIRGMFVTMVAGVYDPDKRRIRLANAGHLPSVMMRGAHMVGEYPAKGPPLGIVPGVGYSVDEIQLENDCCLYLFTDGLMDERQPDGRRSDLDGLVNVFARHSRTAPTERLQHIVADIRVDDAETGDDITILLIED